ncbi:MAG: N-acetyltransferase [Pseudomonadota bacterium]
MHRIRAAEPHDLGAIQALHRTAFGDAEGPVIADLVARLSADPSAAPVHSWVATDEGTVLGHVLFTATRIEAQPARRTAILCPLAVAPERHKTGIGSALVEHGLGALADDGVDPVFVLGDPGYYGRFGFSADHRVSAPYPLPYPEAWQVRSLAGTSLADLNGSLRCADALEAPELW